MMPGVLEIKQGYWMVGVFAILMTGILSLSGCVQHEVSSQSQFYIQYHFTAEGTYQDIEINQSKLVYTYLPEEVAEEKCKQWVASVPCWTAEDLETKETTLSKDEIDELINLINQTGFMKLEASYGGAGEHQRYYSYTLVVKLGGKEKEIVYQSFPGAPPMPEAFKKVREKLLDLVSRKFK